VGYDETHPTRSEDFAMMNAQRIAILGKMGPVARLIKTGAVPKNAELWGGAGVDICLPPGPKPKDRGPATGMDENFSRSDVTVVTPFAHELSWLFYQLRDIAYETELVNSVDKEEFFGRMADAACRYVENHGADQSTPAGLLMAILEEGFEVLKRFAAGRAEPFRVTLESLIANDTGN
jgi:hypothetical protein